MADDDLKCGTTRPSEGARKNVRNENEKKETSPTTRRLVYLPLLEGYMFRLVELQPGQPRDPVSIRVWIVELGYHPDYEAISYVWGDPTCPESISCNGRPLEITTSLHAVFKRVRYTDRSRVLWADAVCINQQNKAERSHHVSFMGETYRHAKRVLVCFGGHDKHTSTWTGSSDDGNDDADDVADLVEEYSSKIPIEVSMATATPTDNPQLDSRDPILADTRWKAVATLSKDPWFTRAWVVQEVGMAKDPVCLYGGGSGREFHYRDLMRLAVWTMICAPQLETRHGISFGSVHTDWIDWSVGWKETSTYPDEVFLDLLCHSRWLECAVRQDHIYAFLGHPLAFVEADNDDERKSPIVEPDYDKPAEQVFLEFGKTLLKHFGLRVLSAVEHDEHTWKDCHSVPSWVPLYHNVNSLTNSLGVFAGFYFDASSSSSSSSAYVDSTEKKYNPIFVNETDLKLRGCQVDVVQKTFKFSEADLQDLEITTTRKEKDDEFEKKTTINKHTCTDSGRKPSDNQNTLLDRIMLEALTDQHHHNGHAYDSSSERVMALSLTLCTGLSTYKCAEDRLEQHCDDFAAYYPHWKQTRREAAAGAASSHDDTAEPELSRKRVLPGDASRGDFERFLTDMRLGCTGRSFILTEKGRFGLGPVSAEAGDVCCVLYGSRVSFVLREWDGTGRYKMKGEVYIHGIMRGEAIKTSEGELDAGIDIVIC